MIELHLQDGSVMSINPALVQSMHQGVTGTILELEGPGDRAAIIVVSERLEDVRRKVAQFALDLSLGVGAQAAAGVHPDHL